MSKNAVISLLPTRMQAENVVAELKAIGVSPDDISVILPDTRGTRDFAHEQNTKAPEGAVTGAGAGVAVGGTLGLLVGIGALAIPGLGPLIAAGPLMAALSGAAVGGAVGGIAGGLVGMGIPELEARQYEGKIRTGNILMAVHCFDDRQVDLVKDVFKRNGSDDVSVTGESGVPDDDFKGVQESAKDRPFSR